MGNDFGQALFAGEDRGARLLWQQVAEQLTAGAGDGRDGVWTELRRHMDRRAYPPGDVIIAQGTLEPDFHVIAEGAVSIAATNPQGLRRQLGALGPGEPIGEMSLLTGEPASADVIALTPVASYALSQQRLATLGEARGRLFEALAGLLAERLRHANDRMLAAYPACTHGICCGREELAALAGLPAAVARTLGGPVLALVVGDDLPLDTFATPVAAGRVEVIRSGATDLPNLPAMLDRAARDHARTLVIGAPAVIRPQASNFTSMLEVVAEGGRPVPDSAGEVAVVTSRRWNLPSLRALSAEMGSPVVAALPLSSPPDPGPTHPVGRLARILTGRKVGVALGAGAAKGMAHIGALRALEELGIAVDLISGSSIGAAIAAGWAAGYTVDQLYAAGRRIASRAVRPTLPLHSFLSNRGIRRELEVIGKGRDFEDLDLPLAICATDLFRRRGVTFTSGPVWPAILASMAIPGIYPPLAVANSYLVDGAVVNPVPSRECREMGAGIVVAIRLSGGDAPEPGNGHRGRGHPLATETIMRSIEILHNRLSELSRSDADITVEVCLEKGGLRDFDKASEIVEAGYRAVMGAREQLAALMPYVEEPA